MVNLELIFLIFLKKMLLLTLLGTAVLKIRNKTRNQQKAGGGEDTWVRLAKAVPYQEMELRPDPTPPKAERVVKTNMFFFSLQFGL